MTRKNQGSNQIQGSNSNLNQNPNLNQNQTQNQNATSFLLSHKILPVESVSLPTNMGVDSFDEEVVELLGRFLGGAALPANVIQDVNPYYMTPWDLTDGTWYFPDSADYAKVNEYGYWKAIGEVRIITKSSTNAFKSIMVFYTGQAPNGARTNWVMHEYKITQKDLDEKKRLTVPEGKAAICRNMGAEKEMDKSWFFSNLRDCEATESGDWKAKGDFCKTFTNSSTIGARSSSGLKTNSVQKVSHSLCRVFLSWGEITDYDEVKLHIENTAISEKCSTDVGVISSDEDSTKTFVERATLPAKVIIDVKPYDSTSADLSGTNVLWSNLTFMAQPLAWDLVSTRLEFGDLLRFSLVCRSWREFSLPFLSSKLLLIIPFGDYMSEENTITCGSSLCFIDFFRRRAYKTETSKICDSEVVGSCPGGWLLTVNRNGAVGMFHPLSKSIVSLPVMETLPSIPNIIKKNISHGIDVYRRCCILKGVMSSPNPNTARLIVVIYGEEKVLAFCRPGKEATWIDFESNGEARSRGFSDICFYGRFLYAVTDNGKVFRAFETGGTSPYLVASTPLPNFSVAVNGCYLVQSVRGELFLVARSRYDTENVDPLLYLDYFQSLIDNGVEYEEKHKYFTCRFQVFELMEGIWWKPVTDIGEDQALFIGSNQSLSIKTSDFPGCKGNSIYFTDDWLERFVKTPYGGHDLGVYDLKRGFPSCVYQAEMMVLKPPPIWFSTAGGYDDAESFFTTVVLRNVFTVAKRRLNANFFLKIKMSLLKECRKFGPIDYIRVLENHQGGVVLVRVKSKNVAQNIANFMNRRRIDNRQICANCYCESPYLDGLDCYADLRKELGAAFDAV